MTPQERTPDERYESVHRAILDGPNAEVQELVDSGLGGDWRDVWAAS